MQATGSARGDVAKVGDRHPTLRALACNQIRTWIVTGRLGPGERLVENILAEELGVSRIPVREALKQLQTEGFVDIAPRRGAVVAEVSMKEAEDFYEVRSALRRARQRSDASRPTSSGCSRSSRRAGRPSARRRGPSSPASTTRSTRRSPPPLAT